MSAGDRDTLAAVLLKHQPLVPMSEWDAMECERCRTEGQYASDEDDAAHVADVLLASGWLAGVKAQAVQDERDRVGPWPGEWVIHEGCDAAPAVTHYHVGDRCPYRTTENTEVVRIDAADAPHDHGLVCKPEQTLRCSLCGETYFICKVCHADVYGHHSKCPGRTTENTGS